jgi:hypothetical protein
VTLALLLKLLLLKLLLLMLLLLPPLSASCARRDLSSSFFAREARAEGGERGAQVSASVVQREQRDNQDSERAAT